MPTPLDVTVVICCYTEARWPLIKAAVASVQRQTLPPVEILVAVDNNPALLERVNNELAGVVAVENRIGRGTSCARNAALPFARGDIVAFLDDDAAAAPDWLAQLVLPYVDSRVLGVGGLVEPDWSKPPPAWFPEEFYWVVGCCYRGLPSQRNPVRNVIGANMSFRRSTLDEIGGFRPSLGHDGNRVWGNDETDLCIRIHQRRPDAIVLYEPKARVRHHVPAARTTWTYFRGRCLSEGMAKAHVSRFVGARDATAAERRYTLRTLPSGVAVALASALRRRERAGVARAAAIVAGLSLATAGFLTRFIQESIMARWAAVPAVAAPRPAD